MSIAPTLQKYLTAENMYDEIQHEPTMSSTRQTCFEDRSAP